METLNKPRPTFSSVWTVNLEKILENDLKILQLFFYASVNKYNKTWNKCVNTFYVSDWKIAMTFFLSQKQIQLCLQSTLFEFMKYCCIQMVKSKLTKDNRLSSLPDVVYYIYRLCLSPRVTADIGCLRHCPAQ